MAVQSDVDKGLAPPKKGDKFRCKPCGMELEVTKDCHCKEEGQVHFHCCGQEMTKV
ncbi:MAG TPA: hypothetical protein VGM05_23775 [Planctomycetaceae bacterium]